MTYQPTQKHYLKEFHTLKELEGLSPHENLKSRIYFISNFDWTDFMLQTAPKGNPKETQWHTETLSRCYRLLRGNL